MHERIAAAAACTAALAALLLPASAAAVTPELAIANLNAQRAASGIPAGIVADPALSAGCVAHDSYMNQNHVLTHSEDPANPGYTPEGAQAGRTSVLASGVGPWTTPKTNPWESAPIHLSQLLDPSLAVSGYDSSFGYSCATTLAEPRRAEPANPVLFSYPGPGVQIYRSERAAESPFTPGDLIGLPQPRVTGPYIYLFADGVDPFATPKTRITAASLKRLGKKKRRVKVKTIDSTNADLGLFLPPGGIVIPVKPLRKGKYRAEVTVVARGRTLKKSWKFSAR
jgi:hypothetical protein